MRIEQYTDELIDLAYETMTIKYYKASEKPEQEPGMYIIQELVFYNDHMLLHVSDENEEYMPLEPCGRFWYEDIETYEFDCDNNLLTLKFYNRPTDINIYGNIVQLQKIYQIITTMDEKFIVADLEEANTLFDEVLEPKL